MFVTHIPVFYKANLYNEINKNKKIFVIFVADETISKRSDDFLTLKEADFPYKVLSEVEFENRNKLQNILKLKAVLSKISFERIIVSGWDLAEFWYIAFTNPRIKNAMALESTIYESKTTGVRALIKKLFLARISKVFASGSLHKALLDRLGFKGQVTITKGVGIIRKPAISFKRDGKVKNRIVYVGRLSPEKNLDKVIHVINELPWLQFDIYGVGPQEQDLKEMAMGNVIFHGAIPNSNLEEIFVNADFFILPSKSEPWGLVVEEALYFGLPVIVSDRCGVVELLDESSIFSLDDDLKVKFLELYESGQKICSNKMSSNLQLSDKDATQVGVYYCV